MRERGRSSSHRLLLRTERKRGGLDGWRSNHHRLIAQWEPFVDIAQTGRCWRRIRDRCREIVEPVIGMIAVAWRRLGLGRRRRFGVVKMR